MRLGVRIFDTGAAALLCEPVDEGGAIGWLAGGDGEGSHAAGESVRYRSLAAGTTAARGARAGGWTAAEAMPHPLVPADVWEAGGEFCRPLLVD